MMIDLLAMGKAARAASRQLARASTSQKNNALLAIADCIEAETSTILTANDADLADARAKQSVTQISDAMLDRLNLRKRITGMVADVRNVAALPDPVGEVFEQQTLENGLRLSRRRTPIGVLGVIYESRPNVTVDVATLCIKTGNGVLLRGGSETLRTNRALANVIRAALEASGLPANAVQFIDDADRRYVGELLKLHQYIDLIIPRGGQSLHQFCRENSTIPVITGGMGICHLYVDQSADLDAALKVIDNAKISGPSACNALDTILVHSAIAPTFIPRVVDFLGAHGVTFRADAAALALSDDPRVTAAGDDDFDTEWLSLVLGIRVVGDVDTAIAHIQQHSIDHSDGILTRDMTQAAHFVDEVDSAAVYVNASTRFTDGAQFGLGAEVAVSTQRIHARGPMGLRELTSYKWVIEGDGHIRV